MDDQKRIEKYYLNLARSWYSPFPSGNLIESKSPDFIIDTPAGPLGIEVTRLFQPSSASSFPPKQVESFREEIIRRAEKIYLESGNPPVDVTAYFTDHPKKQDKERLPRLLAEFVCANYPAEDKVLMFNKKHLAPTSISGFVDVMSIAPPLPGRTRSWTAGMHGQTILLTDNLLAQAISKKNRKIASYRDRVSEVWLLIVADLFPPSASFSVPNEVDGWRFEFKFDRVLLLSREDSKVWDIARNERK